MENTNNDIVPDPWSQAMRSGQYETAWTYSDRILAYRGSQSCWHLPRHQQYVWKGAPLNGKRVLVRCYHGLGDTIQFIRYAPKIKALASKVIVWAQPALIELLKTVDGIDQLLPLHDGTPEVAFDVDVEVMELPHLFRTTLDSIPAVFPYIHPKETKPVWQKRKPAVGLVWKAGEWDHHRSLPFSFLYPLAAITEINFYILQYSPVQAGWDRSFGIYPGELTLDNYAQYLAGLDLLISIDSMPVHLAGSMDKPVWTLLQAEADWRWMSSGDTSPWYTSMRLFRQSRQGEWEPVIREVSTELRRLFT